MTSTAPTQTYEWLNRPVFRQHQRLTPDRLNRVLDHQAARLRQALLGIAGPGIVYGYAIDAHAGKGEAPKGCLYIQCGLAIDCHGRQLFWPGGWVRLKDLAGDLPSGPGKYTLTLHYAEKPANADGCECGDDGAEWTREGVVFSLKPGCQPVKQSCPDPCNTCISTNDYVCGRLGGAHEPIPAAADLSQLCLEPEPPCAVAANGWLYDCKAGSSLACVVVRDLNEGQKGCEPQLGFCHDAAEVCGHRSFVYRNPLLYELIRGCHLDLPRVEKLSFQAWLDRGIHDPVPWQEFSQATRHGLCVWFTKPIKNSTLHVASIFVTVILREQDSFFRDVLRLPLERLKLIDSDGSYCKGVCLEFPKRWVENQIESQLSRFNYGALLELTVRGAFLRDRCDNMLDARPIQLPPHQSGQSMPGDDFVVAFSVAPRRRHERDEPDPAYPDEAPEGAPSRKSQP